MHQTDGPMILNVFTQTGCKGTKYEKVEAFKGGLRPIVYQHRLIDDDQEKNVFKKCTLIISQLYGELYETYRICQQYRFTKVKVVFENDKT